MPDIERGLSLEAISAIHGVPLVIARRWQQEARPYAPSPVLASWAVRTATRTDQHLLEAWASLDALASAIREPGNLADGRGTLARAEAYSVALLAVGRLLVYRARMEGHELAVIEGGDA